MGYLPFERINSDGVWNAKHSADKLFSERLALILFGLSAAVVSIAEFITYLRRAQTDAVTSASYFAALLACAVVGWRSYPYWINGVYHTYLGAYPSVDLDPKALMPMIWIGELWRLPVMLLPLICLVAVPLLVVMSFHGLRRRRFVASAITLGCVAVIVTFTFCFSPDYGPWLMD